MVRYPTAALLSCLFLLVGAKITDPSQWPGLNDLPFCVQNVFQGCLYDCAYGGCIPCDAGCGDWTCACQHFSGAMSAASSRAATSCTSSQTDIAAATSIVNGFCGQLLASPTGPTAPTLPPTASPTSSSGSSSSSGGSADNGAPPSSGGGGGLTTGNKIALGVGLPGAVLAILTIWGIVAGWFRPR